MKKPGIPARKPDLNVLDKPAVLRAVLGVLRESTSALRADEVAKKLGIDRSHVADAFNAARIDVLVEMEGSGVGKGYQYTLTNAGLAMLAEPENAGPSKRKVTPLSGSTHGTGKVKVGIDTADLQGKLAGLQGAQREKKKPETEPPATDPTPTWDHLGQKAQVLFRAGNILALAASRASQAQEKQTVSAVLDGKQDQAKRDQQERMLKEAISALEKQVRQWQDATGTDTPDAARLRLGQLADQLTQAQAMRLDAAVGQAAENQRQWQVATGVLTPEEARLAMEKLVIASAQAGTDQPSREVNAVARGDKRRLTEITGAQLGEAGTVLLTFSRAVNARAVVVPQAQLQAWATVVRAVRK